MKKSVLTVNTLHLVTKAGHCLLEEKAQSKFQSGREHLPDDCDALTLATSSCKACKTQSETRRMHHTEAITPKFCFSGGFCSTENLVFTNERKELFHDMWDILTHSKITSWKKRVVYLPHTGQL